jgi:hypothetical protein
VNAKASNRNKYSAYCEEHLKEFTDDLRDDASWALTSWPGRALALLLTVSSLLNYVDASGRDNPFALYILFAYFHSCTFSCCNFIRINFGKI